MLDQCDLNEIKRIIEEDKDKISQFHREIIEKLLQNSDELNAKLRNVCHYSQKLREKLNCYIRQRMDSTSSCLRINEELEKIEDELGMNRSL